MTSIGRSILSVLLLSGAAVSCTSPDGPTEVLVAGDTHTRQPDGRMPAPDAPRYEYLPNPKEAGIIAQHPKLGSAVYQAKLDADNAASEYGLSRDGFRGNAIRHAMWNVLIAKYSGWYFKSVSDAVSWAERITNAHETGVRQDLGGMNAQMDFHNNLKGRQLFAANAWTEYNPAEKRTEVRARDLAFFTDALRKMADDAARFNSPSQLSEPPYSHSLVFYNQEPRWGVHRLYHPGLPDHFYTKRAGEGTEHGWRTESNNYFYVSSAYSASYVPLYRCFVNGRHYVSLDAKCEAGVAAEGELGRVAKAPQRYTVPLFRLRHPRTRDYLTTYSIAERDNAMNRWGYQYLGVTGHAWTGP